VSLATLTAVGPGQYRVAGDLDFGTVGALANEGERLFASSSSIRIDLKDVGQANSAGLALLLEWLDQAQRRNQRLALINLPESLASIAAITNLASLLPVEPDPAVQRQP
jgi:phospholipid transport system transporter-binding protein